MEVERRLATGFSRSAWKTRFRAEPLAKPTRIGSARFLVGFTSLLDGGVTEYLSRSVLSDQIAPMTAAILVGEFAHESNTFATGRTTETDFQHRRAYEGETMIDELAGTNTVIGGVVDEAGGRSVSLIPTLAANATPGGPVSAGTYESYTEKIVSVARDRAEELDGVLLALHGAMVSETTDDGEGTLVDRVRAVVGPTIPIAVTHDPHGNVSDELLSTANLLVAFETYPHVDMADTGRTALRLLVETARNAVRPVIAVERPPVLPFGPLQDTSDGPMAEVMARARELEAAASILKVNVFPGFHGADVPIMDFSVPVVADDDEAAARAAAREIAERVWERRAAFVATYPDPADGVAEAARLAAEASDDRGPVVLADTGDNPGSGAPADGTVVLREVLAQDVRNAGLALFRDPEVVSVCVDAGVGERLEVDLGGKTDTLHGDPIEGLAGYVKAITDGQFVNTGPMARGTRNQLGRTVLFRCGTDDGVAVILTENRVQPWDAEIWRHVGIQPERLDVLVVKSKNHYRADYEPLASHVIPLNTPGIGAIDPRTLPYERIHRPKYPLDTMADDAYPDW